MICVSLANMGFEECLALAGKEAFVEFRFDLLGFTGDQVEEAVKASRSCIATFRPGKSDEVHRIRILATALRSGADYVDIELEADPGYREEIIRAARAGDSDVIVSYHNFESTPEDGRLNEIVAACKAAGADVVKIACQVEGTGDVQSLLGLYRKAERMVVIGMGEKGLITRVAAPFMGAEFTFASPGSGKRTAPGQIDRERLAGIISLIQDSFPDSQNTKKHTDE